jgi:hypothetical protein
MGPLLLNFRTQTFSNLLKSYSIQVMDSWVNPKFLLKCHLRFLNKKNLVQNQTPELGFRSVDHMLICQDQHIIVVKLRKVIRTCLHNILWYSAI